MNIETISSISQVIGTATIVGGTVFGLIQLYELKKQSRNTVAGELMRTFMSAELANGITIIRGLPDGVSADELRRAGPEAERAAVLICTTFETMGLLVFQRIAPFGLVVELAGGIIVVMWHKLGCGYGTFTLPLARRTAGTVHAIDIDPAMIDTVRRRAAAERLTNINARQRDVTTEGFGLEDRCDACLLFNILHGESPIELIREARRVLRPGGTLAVIHWRSDLATPRGPSADIRPTAPMIVAWAAEAGGLKLDDGPFPLPPWHYGLKFKAV